MKAAIYLRVSEGDRDAGRNDLAIQREKCEAMATLKDWEVAATFVDDSASGSETESKRTGLAGLMDALQAGGIKVVIVSSFDRLATTVKLFLSMISQMDHFGSIFVSCEEGLDTSTPTGQYVIGILKNLAELERLPTVFEEDASSKNDVREGRERLPLGYIRGPEGPEIDIVEARKVRRIFELRDDGYSLEEITQWMNFEGTKPPTADRWTPTNVQDVLNDGEKYLGGPGSDGEQRWPPILST